ncbi:hypothetical protein [Pararhizobium sp. LjRoot238]|uniref:hypothetical protein n=1 Tax=Pararhizobium sp. LjRoot238 TaxID=3342293 RepID=UPI003ED0B6F1
MRKIIIAAFVALLVTSCTQTQSYSELEPIPGSITYNGQPRTKLTKSPIGSTFSHTFLDQTGNGWSETYQIQPDRSLKLIARRRSIEFTLNPGGRL